MTPKRDAGTWILLRGLAREARHWGPLPTELQAALGGARVLTPDNAGCGTESHRSAPFSVSKMVDDLRERLKPDTKISLLGLSLGGMVALNWAERFPEEVRHVVVINTSAGDLSPPFRRLRAGAVRILLGAATARDLRSRERAGFKLTLNDPGVASPERVDEWVRIAESAPISHATFFRQITASAGFHAPKTLRCPILILASSADKMVDPRCSRALAARYRAATLMLHPSAGHDLPLEDPSWVVARISDWLSARGW